MNLSSSPSTPATPARKTRRRVKWYVRVLRSLGLLVILVAIPWFLVTQPILGRNEPTMLEASPERIRADVRMLSETLRPRDIRHPENLKKAADYIAGQFRSVAPENRVSLAPFQLGKNEFYNVVCQLGPEAADGEEGAERILIGAHYDAYLDYPGADDNASGTAGLMELTRLLANQPLNCPLELVAFSLEEPPMYETDEMGSAFYVRQLAERGARVKLMICLEMIGCYSDETGSQAYPAPILKAWYPSRGNFVAVVGQWGDFGPVRQLKRAMRGATDLPVYSINAPRWLPGVDFSDHRNFWAAGIPAVMITDTAFYRNKNYHEAEDTWDTLDYERTAKCVSALAEAVRKLAGADQAD